MRHLRPLLLMTLALALSGPAALASTGPIGPPGTSPRAATRDSPGGGFALVMLLAGGFAAGVVVGLHRIPRRRRAAVTADEPAPAPVPVIEPAPPVDMGPRPEPQPLELVPAPVPRRSGTTARERHVGVYDAEYEQQLIRVQRLRETVSAFVALGGAAASNGGPREPASDEP